MRGIAETAGTWSDMLAATDVLHGALRACPAPENVVDGTDCQHNRPIGRVHKSPLKPLLCGEPSDFAFDSLSGALEALSQ